MREMLGLWRRRRVPVASYADLARRMAQGTSSRTVAATNMNATSSRAHTLVTLTFDQVYRQGAGEPSRLQLLFIVVHILYKYKYSCALTIRCSLIYYYLYIICIL